MPPHSSRNERERAELYALRKLVVTLVRNLANHDATVLNEIKFATTRGSLKPKGDDILVAEDHLKERFDAMLAEATPH